MLAAALIEIVVLTMSPGGEVFARFGHTAIRVEDEAGIRVYNFGAYRGDDPHLVSKLLHNSIPYYLAESDPGLFESRYRDRTVTGQILALDEPEARALAARLAARVGERYHYDWFRDNCTTRARDVIDAVLGGAWHARLAGQPARHHPTIRALLGAQLFTLPSLYTLFSLGLDARVDQPLDAWQELAMPDALLTGLREARRPDGRPLVAGEWVWHGPLRRPWYEPRWLEPLAEVLLLYLLFIGAIARGRLARIAGGLGLVAWGALGSAVGLFCLFWSAMPFPDTFASVNLLAYSPLLIVLVVVGTRLLRGTLGARGRLLARRIVEIVMVVTLLELALHLTGVPRQVHGRHAAYALAALGLSWVILRRVTPTGSAESAPPSA